MSYELIQQADYTLSACGGRVLPGGVVAVDFPGGLIYNSQNTADQVTTGTRDNPEDTTFYVRAISLAQDANTYGRIQWPDGRYMSNQQVSLGGMAWTGPMRRVLTREMPIKPGEAITVITNPVPAQGDGVDTNTSILFEGVYRYLLKGGREYPINGADAGRYARSPNGNILAPEMDLDTEFLEIPQGVERTPYTLQSLSSQTVTIDATGGNATIEVPVSSSFDFFVRRITIEYSVSASPYGDVYVKARDGSGYSLHSDYVPVSKVANAPLAKYWCIKAGVSMFFDFALRSDAGDVGDIILTSVQVIGTRQRGA